MNNEFRKRILGGTLYMCKTNVQVYNECQLKKKKAQVTKEKR